jgi:primase-polymerase (primpol)-like protein
VTPDEGGTSPALRDPKKDPSRKPPTLTVLREGVPIVLTALPQWVRWRWEWDVKRSAWTKVPIQPSAPWKASTADQKTWGSFEAVISKLGKDGVDGIGFVFSASDPFCGIDLDACRDPVSGEISDAGLAVIGDLDGYCEASVTGTGVHVIVRASLGDLGGKKRGFIEIYDRGRYFTVTGHRLDPTGQPA